MTPRQRPHSPLLHSARSVPSVSDLPDTRLFGSAGTLITSSSGIFSVATIISNWFTYWLSIAEPDDGPDCRRADVLLFWRLLGTLLQRGQLYERIWRCQEKSPRVSASASLMRAPVFQRWPAASYGADRAHSGAGRSLRRQQVFR